MTMLRQAVLGMAASWVGTPYRHQASVRGAGADCLGLVRGIWREVYGAEPEAVPPYTPDWSETDGEEALWAAALRHLEPLPLADVRPGDVLLFRMLERRVAKHLGIVGAPEPLPTLIHAYFGHGMMESPLSEPWKRRIVAAFAFPERSF